MDTEIVISRRFRGPPNSGNGGYSCGLLARHLEGTVEVTLHAPPPLDSPLAIAKRDREIYLMDGDQEIAVARPGELVLEPPAAPSLRAARASASNFVSLDQHLFPGCFVCGPARDENDGLRIFPGADDGGRFAAAPWTPDSSLDAGDGTVSPEFVWAALDCPAYFGLLRPGLTAVLGRMTALINSPLAVGEPCIALGWPLFVDGRKHAAGSALFSSEGALIGSARTVWITVDPNNFS